EPAGDGPAHPGVRELLDLLILRTGRGRDGGSLRRLGRGGGGLVGLDVAPDDAPARSTAGELADVDPTFLGQLAGQWADEDPPASFGLGRGRRTARCGGGYRAWVGRRRGSGRWFGRRGGRWGV